MKKYISKSVAATQKIAAAIASKLRGGEIYGLVGNLGGGKTTFMQGLAKSLGVKEHVTSPTFVILKAYKTKKSFNLVHIDLYRVNSWNDAETAGINEFLGQGDKVCFIEWAEKIKEHLPPKTQLIKFNFVDENKREIILDNKQGKIS